MALTSIPVGAGLMAYYSLVQSPDPLNCRSPFLGSYPVSTRLYCAEMMAAEATPEDLSQAINLVKSIPAGDPLTNRRDRLTQQWTRRILDLGEQEYQQGKLEEAIAIVRKVPVDAPTRSQVTAQIKTWQTSWEKAKSIYSKTETAIDQQNWYEALTTARGLLTLGNQYWATTRYQDVMERYRTTKQAYEQQTQAARQPKPSPSAIASSSLLSSSEDFINQWEQDLARQDAAHLKRANGLAAAGTPDNLRAAIEAAEQVLYGSAQYDQARQSIDAWTRRLEMMEDRPRLDRAIALSRRGDMRSLQAAVAQVESIGWGRALYGEAQKRAEQWREQMYQLQAPPPTQPLRSLEAYRPGPVPSVIVPAPPPSVSPPAPPSPRSAVRPAPRVAAPRPAQRPRPTLGSRQPTGSGLDPTRPEFAPLFNDSAPLPAIAPDASPSPALDGATTGTP